MIRTSFFEKYLPKEFHEHWLIINKHNSQGAFKMYIREIKNENAGEVDESGKMPPPVRLKQWLKAISSGETIEAAYEPRPDMSGTGPRLEKLDEFDVEACDMFVGKFVAAFGHLIKLAQDRVSAGAKAVFAEESSSNQTRDQRRNGIWKSQQLSIDTSERLRHLCRGTVTNQRSNLGSKTMGHLRVSASYSSMREKNFL